MSEKVQSFNPFLILIWILQILILAIDYNADRKVTWSIPVIGSFLVVQLYMVWKTNYDEMMEEQRAAMTRSGNDIVSNTPLIRPGSTNLQAANSGSNPMIQLNLSPSVSEEKEENA